MDRVLQPGSRAPARPTERATDRLSPRLSTELRRLDRQIRALSILSGLAATVIVMAAFALAVFAIDSWIDLSSVSRAVALFVLLTTGGVFVAFTIRRLFCEVPLPELAAAVEGQHPEFGERLLSLVEFSQPGVEDKDKGSAMMRTLLERETLQLVSAADFTSVIDHSRTRWRAIAACLAMGLLLLPFAFGASSYRLHWARLLAPWNNYERPSNLYFEIPNGDRVVPRDEDAKIVAVAGWRNQQPEQLNEVRLTWAFEGAATESRRMAWDEAANAYSATLPAIQHGFRYSVSSGRARTREYQIQVQDRPAITSLKIDVQPPMYSGLPAAQYSAAALEIPAFEHSQISFNLALNKPVRHLDLVWIELESANDTAAAKAARIEEDSPEALYLKSKETELVIPDHLRGKFPGWIIRAIEPLALGADGKSAQLTIQADRPGRFILHAVDEYDLDNPQEPIRSIDLQIDQPPTVEFADNNEQGTAKPDEIITVPVYATDDIGLAALEMEVKTFPEGKLLKTISVESSKLGTQELGEAFQVNLAEFGLLPNDTISLRSRAADERQIPGPQEAWTNERLVRIQLDSLPYGFEEIAKEREEWKNQLEQLRNEVIANRTEVQDVQKALDKAIKSNQPFDQDGKVPPLTDTQRAIADRGAKIAATFASHPLFERLAAPLEQVAREDMIPAADKAQQVPTTPDLTAKAELLKETITELNQAESTLNELQIRYEQQSMLERDLFELQRLANRTEQLAEDTEKFEEQRDDAETPKVEQAPDSPPAKSTEEQQQQRDTLLARHQSLSQDLDQLIFKRPELVSAAQEALIGRTQKLFEQAGLLAGKEDKLSAALTREAQQLAEPTQPPAPESPPAEGSSPPAPEPAQPAETQLTDTPPSPPPAADSPPTEPSKTDAPPAAPPADPSAEQTSEAVAKAIDEQRGIALAARELALNSEAQTGKDSAATKSARQFAEQTQAALQELTTGNADTAAEAGQGAAQNGEQAAEQFRKQPKSLGGANEEMAASSQKLATRQAQVAAQMNSISQSPTGRREVQQQAQQQLQRETQRLTNELGQVAESFGMQPLQQDEKMQEAQASGTSAKRAQDAMLAARQSLQENKPLEAAQRATEAAQALREAGHLPPSTDPGSDQTTTPKPEQDASTNPSDPSQPKSESPDAGKSGEGPAEPPPPSPGGNSSVPPEGALNVAQAAQQLNKIGKKLAQGNAHGTAGQKPGEGKPEGDPQSTPDGQKPEGDSTPNPDGESQQTAKSGENSDGSNEAKPKDGQSQNGSNQSGKNGSEQNASNQLKQTAANMRKAMSQFGLPNGKPGKPNSGGKSESNQDAQATNQSDFGNTDEARIVELENHLRGLTTRNWGELPGSLKTEILQATRKKPDGDYSQLIRRYFDEISRTQSPELPEATVPAGEGAAP